MKWTDVGPWRHLAGIQVALVVVVFVIAMGVSLLCDCTVEGSNFPNEERGHVHRKKLTETDKGNNLSVELKEVGNKEEKPLNA